MEGTKTETAQAERLSEEFVIEFGERWGEAWANRDGEALAALCTEDIEFTDPAVGTLQGRAEVAEWVRSFARGFPDYRFEDIEPPYIASDRPKVIYPWRMLGTNTGPIDPPGFAATGRSIVVEGVDHWWFRGELVERYRADYDSLDVMRQLGLMPESGSTIEKGMAGLQRLGKTVEARLRRS
jgi:steroid delta-isomerase-like uncharacterized protein